LSNIQLPEWAEPLFSEEYRYFALWGGRGSSKSHSVAMALVVMAAQRPLRILCTREVQKSIRDSVKRLLDDKIEAAGFKGMFTSTDTEIRGTNGSLFVFAGLQHNVQNIKSMEGIDVCWCEEAQTLSQTSINTLIPTIRKPGSRLFFTWNPRDPKDPVDVMFKGEDGPPPRSFVLRVNYDMNPWLPQVLRDEMEHDKKRDRGMYLHTWEGEYLTRSNANVFQDWRIEDFETPDDAFFRFGCDWGFSVDPTVLIRAFTVGRKLYFDYEAYQVGCEIDDTPTLFAQVPESERWPIIADSASPERISYMRKHGYPKIMKAVKGRKSIEEGIAFMQSFEIIVHPRCSNLIYEFEHYSYRVDPITDEITNVLSDKDNHCIAEGQKVYVNGQWKQIERVCAGDVVMTRGGWQKVTRLIDNGIREVMTIKTCFYELTCTPCHKILTDRGWIRADEVKLKDTVLCYDDFNEYKPPRFSDWCYAEAHNDGGLIDDIELGYATDTVIGICIDINHPKKRVYDLSVENYHEFVASNFTVVNCIDSARYGLESIRRTTKAKQRPDFVPLPNKNFWN
jgi:phage terminase large subunit